MKRSNATTIDFSQRTRQSYVAILLIIYKTYRIIVRQIWPFLIYFAIGGTFAKSKIVTFLIIGALIGMVFSIIKFFRYFFYIEDDELVIEQGVLSRSRTNVPFDRIQVINFEQNIIHRIFNVVRLKVDTAGSVKNELEFEAIDQSTADRLREILLAKKQEKKKGNVAEGEQEEAVATSYRKILHLDVPQLLRAGLVENHLKSGGLIFAFLFWIWQTADEMDMSQRIEEPVASIEYGLVLLVSIIVLFIVISFVISLVRMVIRNYDLVFLRSDRGFKINAGLFTKRDVSAQDHKIQMISWADNPLKKLIKIKDLRLRQAASQAVTINKTIKVPSCDQASLDDVTRCLYGEKYDDNIDYEKIHFSYFYRIAMYIMLIGIPLIGLSIWAQFYNATVILSLVLIYLLVTRFLSQKKKRYGHNDEMLIIHGGAYGDKTEILPIYKIQSCSLSTTPYQRRKGLATVIIHTASGRVGIPYIYEERAQQLLDTFLYKVERDKRKWM